MAFFSAGRLLQTAGFSCQIILAGLIIGLVALPIAASAAPDTRNYAAFQEAWNRQCEKIGAPPKYLLIGDRARAANDVLAALDAWCVIFTQKEQADCARELALLADETPKSSFHAYAAFREKHWRQKALVLEGAVDSQELAHRLNSYLGIKINGRAPDYVAPETVATVIEMNSFRFYLERNLRRLQRRGIDRQINSGNDLATGGRYPCLDAWLEKDAARPPASPENRQ